MGSVLLCGVDLFQFPSLITFFLCCNLQSNNYQIQCSLLEVLEIDLYPTIHATCGIRTCNYVMTVPHPFQYH